MSVGIGYGKVILFGEHFVVQGNPGIVAGINDRTIATVESSKKFELVDNRPEIPGYKQEKLGQQKESMKLIFSKMNIDPEKNPVKIVLWGNLLAASGVGASAASCAAIARALAEHFGQENSDERINEIAFEGEKAYHGNPSGIDNTAATYGGILWFIRGPPIKFERIGVKKPVEIVLGNTGIIGDSKKAILGVVERSKNNPEKYGPIFEEAKEIAVKARKALEEGKVKEIGYLANRNHELLQQVEVSCKELDELVEFALQNGASGAKMTGSGLGGYMFAVTPGKELQERVATAMQEKGYQTIKTGVG